MYRLANLRISPATDKMLQNYTLNNFFFLPALYLLKWFIDISIVIFHIVNDQIK